MQPLSHLGSSTWLTLASLLQLPSPGFGLQQSRHGGNQSGRQKPPRRCVALIESLSNRSLEGLSNRSPTPSSLIRRQHPPRSYVANTLLASMSPTPSPSPISHAVTPLAPPLPTAPAVPASARRLEAHASSSKPSTPALDASSRNPHGAVLQEASPRTFHLYLSPLP